MPDNLRRKRAAQNALLAQSLAAGLDPNSIQPTAQQMAAVKLPKLVHLQLPDGTILRSSETRARNFLLQNPKARIIR